MNESPSKFRVAIAFAAIYVVWGSTYLAIRFGVETIPPFIVAGTRFLAAGGLMYGWARMRGGQVRAEFAEAFEVVRWIL